MSRDRPLANSPWRLRCLMAALVAVSCALLATPEPAEVYTTDINSQTVHYKATSRIGWPLRAIDVIRQGSREPKESVTIRASREPITGIELRWPAFLYDLFVVSVLVVATVTSFLPWRDFPRPRFSLLDVFVVLTCVTIGSVVWYQMCASRANADPGDLGWFIVQSAMYAVITLATAGALNGLIAQAGEWLRQRAIVATSDSQQRESR